MPATSHDRNRHGHKHHHAQGRENDHGHVHAPASFGAAFAVGICLNFGFVVLEAIFGF
jgi:cobalt-zinc-cadmium efflux system protein